MWLDELHRLCHHNVPAHNTLRIQQFVTETIAVIGQAAYSPNIVQCDFFIIPKLKEDMLLRCQEHR